MTIQDLARLVADMRNAQRHLHRTDSASALTEAKRLERRVDETIKFLLSPQRDLFDADTTTEGGQR
jgi:CHASE1-domain containing sensor protein